MQESSSGKGGRNLRLSPMPWGDALSKKPTRFLAFGINWVEFTRFPGVHQLDPDGQYMGPLPRACGHDHAPLLGKDEHGNRRTSKAAAYPPGMCKWLAASLLNLRVEGGAPAAGKSLDTSQNVELEVFNWRWAPWPSWKVSMLGEPSGEMEIKARKLALAGRVTETEILGLCDVIPGEESARGRRPFERPTESLFTSGAFIHGGVCGLRANCRSCPWTTALLACIIQCVCPGSSFSSVVLSRNIKTGLHRDLNNEAGSHNTVIKASSFTGGGSSWKIQGEHTSSLMRAKRLPAGKPPSRVGPYSLIPLCYMPLRRGREQGW